MIRLIAMTSIATAILYENKDHVAKFIYQIGIMTAKKSFDGFFRWFGRNL